ncbi:hypothetical protein ABZX92_45360 [Lentzea sp. NPDC006480]|uniref:hypothetical protein n=1 Tax=Lentzea sp. NPDC006480 TaxID=3157176 RepID=UPI0033A31BB8
MRSLLPALILLVVASTGCGAGETVVVTDKAPALSNVDAQSVIAAYDRGNNQANSALDPAMLAEIEAPPLRTTSEAALRIAKKLAKTVPLITSNDTRFLVPADANWFVVMSNRVRGGVPSPRPTYTLFTRGDNGKWLATYSLLTTEDVPPADMNSAAAASAVVDFADLLIPPADLGKQLLEHYTRGLAGKDSFARSVALDDQLTNGYVVGQQVMAGRGYSLQRTLAPASHPIFALRTNDGGALVFSATTVVDSIKADAVDGAVTLNPTGNEAALLSGGSQTAPAFRVTRVQTYLTYVPKKSELKAKVLAFTDTPVETSATTQGDFQ